MKAATKVYLPMGRIDVSDMEFTEKLVSLDRVTKVVKGGKNMHFRALVVAVCWSPTQLRQVLASHVAFPR